MLVGTRIKKMFLGYTKKLYEAQMVSKDIPYCINKNFNTISKGIQKIAALF